MLVDVILNLLTAVRHVTACNLFMAVLCTKEWRSGARGCGQQIEGHESFLVTSVLLHETFYTGIDSHVLNEVSLV